ncbi:MAG: hypothetical protein JSW04_04440 [Desulfobacterales bacterium]|nr:MAG: hypothetical protein JSW04_04440 [Desulfobacterales bacterium]
MFEIENRPTSDRAGERMLSENELDATRFQEKRGNDCCKTESLGFDDGIFRFSI